MHFFSTGSFLQHLVPKIGENPIFLVTLESDFQPGNRYTNDVIGVISHTSMSSAEVCGSSPPNSLWLPSYVVPKSGTPWGCLLLALFARFDHDLGLLP